MVLKRSVKKRKLLFRQIQNTCYMLIVHIMLIAANADQLHEQHTSSPSAVGSNWSEDVIFSSLHCTNVAKRSCSTSKPAMANLPIKFTRQSAWWSMTWITIYWIVACSEFHIKQYILDECSPVCELSVQDHVYWGALDNTQGIHKSYVAKRIQSIKVISFVTFW